MKLNEEWRKSRWRARLNRGDASVFIEVYDALAPKVLRHVKLRVETSEVAEDLAAETFLKAWQYIAANRPKIKSVKAFIFKIANNLIIDHYRQRGKEESADMAELEVEARSGQEKDLSAGIDLKIDRAKILAAIKALPSQYQQIIIWRYIDDLSVAEIAALIGKSKDAVYVAIFRALKGLKRRLGQN